MRNTKQNAKRSKRYPFIAEHRGGPLTKRNHRKLIRWARECTEHVLFLIEKRIDKKLLHALDIAKKWEEDDVRTGVAMKASLGAHAVARRTKDPVVKAVARSVGQTAATAHMADHSLGGAFYALKAIKSANLNVKKEKEWQDKKLAKLPKQIMVIVQTAWKSKALDKRI